MTERISERLERIVQDLDWAASLVGRSDAQCVLANAAEELATIRLEIDRKALLGRFAR